MINLFVFIFSILVSQCSYQSRFPLEISVLENFSRNQIDSANNTIIVYKGVVLGESPIALNVIEIKNVNNELTLNSMILDSESGEPLPEAEILYSVLISEDESAMKFMIKHHVYSDSTGKVSFKSRYFDNSFIICSYIGYSTRVVKIKSK
ncbi:MAG: carboxypeptidase-like regulatory domain-containing protein [Bacteroidetes bacterium]|nr:carboxypeptidase-like regulatory domain-containing protein [Bacteroidota bacterium]